MCGEASLTRVMSLTPTPPGNDFLTKEELGRNEKTYPLDLYFCIDCKHFQLGHVVDPKILYQKNYSYVSATSQHFVRHLKNYATKMIDFFGLQPGDLVVDIGSNDGTCLRFFEEKGMHVLGIDPAKSIADEATKNGIETVADFFSYDLALVLREKYGAVKYITSHNACAHIDDLFDVMKGVEYWLAEDGIFVLEVGYLVDVYNNIWFDTIYHEHLDYHTVAPFDRLFDRVEMEVISVERISPQGGSIRVMVQKKGGPLKRDNSVDKLIKLEHKLGLDRAETLSKLDTKINKAREELQILIQSLKADGKKIAGFGAPTKATTLMAHFGLDETVLDFIVDDNPLKQGLFTPITHIPVLSSDVLYEMKPDYVLILAWNFSEPIMKMHTKYSNEIGQFILPISKSIPKVIRLANEDDYAACLRLLNEHSKYHTSVSPDYLHLNNETGFTLLVLEDEIIVAISTFTYRLKKTDKTQKTFVYWENLYVVPGARDGLAYIKIYSYLRTMLKMQKIYDVYFLVRREEAKLVHKSAGFHTRGFINVELSSIQMNFSQKVSSVITVISYKQFPQFFSELESPIQENLIKSISNNILWDKEKINRQLENKNGLVMIDMKTKRMSFVRIIKVTKWITICLPLSRNIDKEDILCIKSNLPIGLVICLKISSYIINKKNLFTVKSYELLDLNNSMNINDFHPLEHDAL